MLDTYCRKYIQPIIKKGAIVAIKSGFSANQITVLAMIFGVVSGSLYYLNYPILAILILWISGYLDAMDGTVARETKCSSSFGTVMDITFDRIVESVIILAVALKHPQVQLKCLLLMIAILISMTIFLTTGPLAENKGEKTFYYQTGIAERTEGFIFLSLMMLVNKKIEILIVVFIILVLFTAGQRFIEAKKILK